MNIDLGFVFLIFATIPGVKVYFLNSTSWIHNIQYIKDGGMKNISYVLFGVFHLHKYIK